MFHMTKFTLKILTGIFVIVIAVQAIIVSQLSDGLLVVRAVSPTKDFLDHLTPSWMALAKLKTFGFNSCDLPKGDSTIPVISFIVAGYGDIGLDEDTSDSLIEMAIEQGCSINAKEDTGLAPIHASIIFDQPRVLSLLIGLGAKTAIKVEREGSAIDGLDTIELGHYIAENHPSKNSNQLINILIENK